MLPDVTDRTLIEEQVERIACSSTLHSSESLRKLLRYLAKQSLLHPGHPTKEYQIATELFGRQADFDPQVDSMVRVQAGRLRSKLIEYYGKEGQSDEVLVELPRGSYALIFHPRPAETLIEHPNGRNKRREENRSLPKASKWMIAALFLGIGLLAAVSMIASLLYARRAGTALTPISEAPASLRVFWNGFRKGPDEPWVVFSNAAFVGRPDVGMRYYDPVRDTGQHILDHYTGVGEVLAVHSLDQVFNALHSGLRVKRGNLFSLDDAKNDDLIFIGSPSENLTLLEIPNTKEFVFRRVLTGPRAGDVTIMNLHPGPGEAGEYLASPSNVPLVEDYGVIALVPGLNPPHSELILAGTTTIGTQAAVEFVTRENSLAELLKQLDVAKAADLQPFEAVIRVKVARGVPVGSEIVAIRKARP